MKNPQKSPPKFSCECCDYTTSNKKDFNKHLLTPKHQMETIGNKKIPKRCPFCNKTYKTNSGLWKHKKKCNQQIIVVENNELTGKNKNALTKDDIITQQHEQIRELKSMMMQVLEDNSESAKLIREMMPKIGNTTNINQKISINVFLNEHCKNALNFKDFIETINVSLEDVLKTKEIGYSKGISNIFIKNLNELETTERPIHCSDKKRLQFYVKDEDEWNKDHGEKMKTAITDCQKKQLEQIKLWEKDNDGWVKDDKKSDEYIKMLREVLGDTTELEKEKNIKDIIKNVGDNILLKDAILEI